MIAAPDRWRFEELLHAELIGTEVFAPGARVGRLSPNAQRLVTYLLAQEQAHVLLLTHALGLRSPPAAAEDRA